jgi:hypothetical protein
MEDNFTERFELPEADRKRAKKTLDEDLRQLVVRNEAEPVSVIVELNLPRPRVEMGSDPGRGTSGRRAQRVVPAKENPRESQQIIEEVGEFLEKVADEPPVWLDASRAFVMNTTTDQLENIARSSRVRRISRNRAWTYVPLPHADQEESPRRVRSSFRGQQDSP